MKSISPYFQNLAEKRNNIYWRDIPQNTNDVELGRDGIYRYYGQVVFWHGHEAMEAQKWLVSHYIKG
jgi:predicted acetyltransferase